MPPLPRSIHVGALLALALAGPSNAQVVNPPNEPSGAVPEKKIPVEKKPAGSGEDTVELSPFTVTAENNGYQASNTMSGTRLNTKLEDLASSITVITKQQLIDTAAVDINDIFSNEGNTEGVFQYTDFTIDRGFTVDNVAQTPETANRVRGLGTANLARGNFAASRAIPVDTYNLDSVEISRGPNSNIFGLGEASGTVNLISGRANLTRDISQVLVRVDDRGSFRSTFDLNRVLWKNKLAARVAAVHDDTEYVRKPSRDKSNRMTAAFSFRPFSNTTLRGSYESIPQLCESRELHHPARHDHRVAGQWQSGLGPHVPEQHRRLAVAQWHHLHRDDGSARDRWASSGHAQRRHRILESPERLCESGRHGWRLCGQPHFHDRESGWCQYTTSLPANRNALPERRRRLWNTSFPALPATRA
jgi:outer membrane receptor protein involved in Fe transport